MIKKGVESVICNLCPRNCNAERTEHDRAGFCNMPLNPVIAQADLHFWEEPCISGKGGGGAVFFSGCSLKCCYCQNFKISSKGYGKEIGVGRLADIFKELEDKGASCIDLVSPSHFAYSVLKAFDIYKPQIPVVYNSSGYEKVETLKMFEGIVDVYLPDLKYVESEISEKYSSCKDYFQYASEAIKEMKRQVPENIFVDGLIKKGLIIRHLVLPSNMENSRRVLRWIRENLGDGEYISLMSQYTPCSESEKHPEINRTLMTAEYDKILDYFFEIGLKNGYMQEKSSAKEIFVPPFDLRGI